MNVALANKFIDATVQLEPYVTKAQMDGIAEKGLMLHLNLIP